MFRQKTNWILVVAIWFVALLFAFCGKNGSEQKANLVVNDSTDVYLIKDGNRMFLVAEIRCGEAGSPPCNLFLPDTSEIDTLDADTARVEITADSSRSDSGIVILNYKIDANFEIPYEE